MLDGMGGKIAGGRTLTILGCLAVLLLQGCAFTIKDDMLINKVVVEKRLSELAPEHAITVAMPDGDKLEGLFIPSPQARASVLFLGGNAQSVQGNYRFLTQYADKQHVNVMSVNYRGYAFSEGQAHTETLADDAAIWLEYLRARPEAKGLSIVMHGLSIGSITTGAFLGRAHVDGVILESTVTDVRQWEENAVPGWVKLFVRLEYGPFITVYDNRSNIKRYNGPLLVITGGQDRLTPPVMSRAVFEASGSAKKQLLEIPQGGHVGLWVYPEYQGAVDRFLSELKSEQPAASVNPTAAIAAN
ncbi:lysophospholipase [Burkholderiaceae bacterium DAT-1]|nr:lysophospholipase [Burkholderiaceae bacterium DAT-1]